MLSVGNYSSSSRLRGCGFLVVNSDEQKIPLEQKEGAADWLCLTNLTTWERDDYTKRPLKRSSLTMRSNKNNV